MGGKKVEAEINSAIVPCEKCKHLIFKEFPSKKVVEKNAYQTFEINKSIGTYTYHDKDFWYGQDCAPAYTSFENKSVELWQDTVVTTTHYYIAGVEVTEDGRSFINPDDCNSGGENQTPPENLSAGS